MYRHRATRPKNLLKLKNLLKPKNLLKLKNLLTKVPRHLTKTWRRRLPGVLLTALVAASITLIVPRGVGPISPIVIALLCGMAIRHTLGIRPYYKTGIDYTAKTLLKLAIILLGLRFGFHQLFALGVRGLILIALCTVGAAVATLLVAKILRIRPRLATLIGLGTVICGNSAIMAAAPAIGADDDEVALSVTTITIFGTAAVFLYPLLGALLELSSGAFGLWSGTAVHDTAQVVATAFAYSSEAGEVATLVKMVRNLLMGPIILLVSLSFARHQEKGSDVSMIGVFPWFVLGFLGLSITNSFLNLPASASWLAQAMSVFLIKMVLVAVGLNTDWRKMQRLGLLGFVLGFCAAAILAVFSLSFILFAEPWLLGVSSP